MMNIQEEAYYAMKYGALSHDSYREILGRADLYPDQDILDLIIRDENTYEIIYADGSTFHSFPDLGCNDRKNIFQILFWALGVAGIIVLLVGQPLIALLCGLIMGGIWHKTV